MILAGAVSVRAETRQSFDAPGTPFAAKMHCAPPPAQVTAGGPFGNFLRLAHDSVPNCNTVSFDRSDEGAYGFTVASFWFRMTPRRQRADGLSFALLNTAVHGNSGPADPESPLFAAEEPDYRGSLGVGFDIYDNAEYPDRETQSDNHVSIHYDGKVVAVFRIKKTDLDLAPSGGRWIHAWVIVRAASGYSDVRVILTPVGALQAPGFDGQVAVPGLAPYEARVHFGARSGGSTAEHDLDSVLVRFSDQPPPTTFHDLDAPGTGFSPGQHCHAPPATLLAGGWSGSFLRLAHGVPPPPQAPNCNSIAFDRTSPGLHTSVTARFDIRMTTVGNGRADGMGFALLDTARYGNQGPVASELPPFVAEEPNFAGSVAVGFDIHRASFPPDQDPSDNHVSIHFDGRTIAVYPVARPTLDLGGGEPIQVTVTVSHGASGAQVLVRLAPPPPGLPLDLPPTAVPELRPYESRAYFAARSGHESAHHDLDNVTVSWSGAPDPALYGAWGPVFHWGKLDDPNLKPAVPIHLHLLPTGKVMSWDRHHDEEHPSHWDGAPRIWDPTTGGFQRAAEPDGYDIFCSGHAFLANGQLMVAGGHFLDNVGLDRASRYDPFADRWTEGPRMNAGRWYPTTTTLASGALLVVSGDVSRNPPPQPPTVNELPQVWEPQEGRPSGLWRDLTSAQRRLPLYPWMFQASDGRVFNAGPDPATAFLDVSGAGHWSKVVPRPGGARNEGSAVMWDGGEVLIMGGGGGGGEATPPTAEVNVIDLDALGGLVWTEMPSMSYRRRFLTPTLLPDGRALVTGGTALNGNRTAGAVFVPEMWDPDTQSWSLMAGMNVPRLYHSAALLLPDARVLVAGGGHPESDDQGIDHTNAQLYSPPYLFKGPRPIITSVAPRRLVYGRTFSVGTPDPQDIGGVSLVRLGSVTHTFNQNQRFNHLDFLPTAEGLEVTAPAEPGRCPPGHYMLFLLSREGVPSMAEIVSIGEAHLRSEEAN